MALYQRFQRQFFSHIKFARIAVAIFVLLLAFTGYKYVFGPIYSQASRLWSAYQRVLPGFEGRTNFLLLGIAGDTRDGNQLTDTIIVVSVDQKTGDVALISVPRDIWIPSMQAKINTAYYYGEQKNGGLQLAKSAVSEVLGLPVHFAAIIDFRSFEKSIDLLGGVDVIVDRSFIDRKYPITGLENDTCLPCRYETVEFVAGSTRMNGATALKFARSRHAVGDEGTDFARSARQEKIITAVQAKLLTGNVIANRALMLSLYSNFKQSIINDVDQAYYLSLTRLTLRAYKKPVRTVSISELFINPQISKEYGFQWVLVPKKDVSVAAHVKDFLTVPTNK